MIIKPQLKKSFRFVIPDPDNVVLLDESDYKLLTGRAYASIVPLLNGQHTADELVDLLGGKVFPPEVYYALHLLEAEGHIIEADDAFSDEVAAFWQLEC
jgi:ribosomal protein S12 methylthiotransferase accessory factor